MHAQLRVTQIQSPHAKTGGKAGTDGATAGTVVANDEKLERDGRSTSAFLEEDDAGGVCGVALVGVDFDDRAAVDGGLVGGFVFAGVVGVDGVSHVGGDEEGFGEGLLVGGGCSCGLFRKVDVLVTAVAGGRVSACGGENGESAEDGGEEVGVGALGGLGADFFVVEADGHADGGVAVEGGGRGCGGDEAHDGAVCHAEVVETRGEDEFVAETADAGLLSVV